MSEKATKVLILVAGLYGAIVIYNKFSGWNSAHRTLQAKVFSAEVVETSALRIVDKAGNRRGSLEVAESGAVYLTLRSLNTDASVLLRVGEDE